MITNIPMIYSQQLKNANERTFISILWILSGYNHSPAFFSKEYINYIGSLKVFDTLIKTLTQRNIISYQVKGAGSSKHRYFQIIDPAIVEELKQNTKPQTQTKPQKEIQNKSLKDRFVEKQQQQLELNFDAVFSQMKKLVTSFNYCFSDTELQTQAQNYLDKSQAYKFYKGKPTEAKIKAWLNQYLEQKKEKAQGPSGSGDLAKRMSFMNQLNEMSKRSDNEKKSDPIDADFEIIDEHKNAPA